MAGKVKITAPAWYRGWMGERKCIPRSQKQGIEKAVTELFPLQAQIAAFFGSKEGDIETLKSGILKLHAGEQIVCESCRAVISQQSHTADCELIAWCMDVIAKESPALNRPAIDC